MPSDPHISFLHWLSRWIRFTVVYGSFI